MHIYLQIMKDSFVMNSWLISYSTTIFLKGPKNLTPGTTPPPPPLDPFSAIRLSKLLSAIISPIFV